MSGSFRTYATCGVLLRSEIELHVPLATPRPDDGEVVVTWGPELVADGEPPAGDVVARDEAHGVGWYTVTDTGVDHRLRFRDCAEFVIAGDTGSITVRPVSGGRSELIPVLLAGTVTALLLTLRGATVVHAGAVAVDGRALAIVAQSGRGKSTLAALLCASGADLVADDVLAVGSPTPISCCGGASELRLRPASAAIATDDPTAATRATADERTAWRPSLHGGEPIELGAIVFPFPSRTATELELRRVSPEEALLGLLACPRINGWKRAAEIGRSFTVLGEVAASVPAHAALVPWGPPFDPGIARRLASLVADDHGGWVRTRHGGGA